MLGKYEQLLIRLASRKSSQIQGRQWPDAQHWVNNFHSVSFASFIFTAFWSDPDFTVEILTCALKKYFNEAFPPSNVPLAMSVPPYLLCFTVQVLGFMRGIQHHPSPTSAGGFPLEGTSLPQTKGGQIRVIQTVVMLIGVRHWCENKSKLLWEDKNPAWCARVAREGDGRRLRHLRGAERFLFTIMNEQSGERTLKDHLVQLFMAKGPHII